MMDSGAVASGGLGGAVPFLDRSGDPAEAGSPFGGVKPPLHSNQGSTDSHERLSFGELLWDDVNSTHLLPAA